MIKIQGTNITFRVPSSWAVLTCKVEFLELRGQSWVGTEGHLLGSTSPAWGPPSSSGAPATPEAGQPRRPVGPAPQPLLMCFVGMKWEYPRSVFVQYEGVFVLRRCLNLLESELQAQRQEGEGGKPSSSSCWARPGRWQGERSWRTDTPHVCVWEASLEKKETC